MNKIQLKKLYNAAVTFIDMDFRPVYCAVFVSCRPEFLMVAFIVSIGLLIGLMFKRKEHPTNMYMLFAFVSCIFDNHINY